MVTLSTEMLSWVHVVGLSLLHSLWQGVLIGAGYALIRVLVPKAQAGVRYFSGLIALFFLVFFPLLTLWLLRPAAEADALIGAVVANDAAALSLTTLVEPASSETFISTLLPAIVAIWLLGVVICLLRAVHQWRALDRIVFQFSESCAELDRLLQSVAPRFGGIGRIRVLVSSRIDTPTLIGWLKPVILLPTAVAIGFPRHQLELILAHELGHLRRHDHFVNLVQVVIETVLFYHPVVHWISREVRHEREICCDQLVLRVTEGQPAEYARTLAALEGMRQTSSQLAVAATGGRLVDRVRRILGLPTSSGAPIRVSPVRLVAVLAVFVGLLGVALQVERGNHDESMDDWAQVSPLAPSSFPVVEFAKPAVALPEIDFTSVPDVVASSELIEETVEPLPAAANVATGKLVSQVSAVGDIEPAVVPINPAVVVASDESSVHAQATLAPDVGVPLAVARDPVETSAATVASHATAAVSAQPTVEREPSSAPVVVRRIAPTYPSANLSRSKGHVEFEFAIDSDGRVRNITIVAGDSMGAYADAARRALRQWRFEPEATGYGARRFQQDFVFINRPLVEADGEETRCARSTGSHICRPIRVTEGVAEVLDLKMANRDPLAMKSN